MVEVDSAEFELLVADALDSLPPELARLMDNVAIFVEDEFTGERDLLGLYEGVPLTERDSAYRFVSPDRITIFRLPTLRICRTRDDVRRQVAITVVHEVGHHFGIDDERLHELGYG